MKIIKILSIIIVVSLSYSATAQMAINNDGTPANSTAMLDVKSTTGGLLLPRLTTLQISAIANPVNGLMVYNTDSLDFYGFNGAKWIAIWDNSDTLADWYCGNPYTDSRDGKIYETVSIGNQCWMAENLNIGTRINGGTNQTNNSIIEKYCYNDTEDSCTIYGGLYQWDEMMQYASSEQGICPTGWHIPSDIDWKTMEIYLGMSSSDADNTGWRGTDEGDKLRETGTAHWKSPNSTATNSSGFTAYGGGERANASVTGFKGILSNGFWWTSSKDLFQQGIYWYRGLRYDHSSVSRSEGDGQSEYSVRCVR